MHQMLRLPRESSRAPAYVSTIANPLKSLTISEGVLWEDQMGGAGAANQIETACISVVFLFIENAPKSQENIRKG